MLLFNFPRLVLLRRHIPDLKTSYVIVQHGWKDYTLKFLKNLKTSYVIVQLFQILPLYIRLLYLKTSYVIVQPGYANSDGVNINRFKNILCYCSTEVFTTLDAGDYNLKTSYVIVQPTENRPFSFCCFIFPYIIAIFATFTSYS